MNKVLSTIAALCLGLAVLVLPANAQKAAPEQPQQVVPPTDASKPPMTVLYHPSSSYPPSQATTDLVKGFVTILSDQFTVTQVEKPLADDAPTQYVLVILAGNIPGGIKGEDGKQVPQDLLSISGLLHIKGKPLPLYLFNVPTTLGAEDEVGVIEAVLQYFDDASGFIDDYGIDKL